MGQQLYAMNRRQVVLVGKLKRSAIGMMNDVDLRYPPIILSKDTRYVLSGACSHARAKKDRKLLRLQLLRQFLVTGIESRIEVVHVAQ
jgi:hypothetical protein